MEGEAGGGDPMGFASHYNYLGKKAAPIAAPSVTAITPTVWSLWIPGWVLAAAREQGGWGGGAGDWIQSIVHGLFPRF